MVVDGFLGRPLDGGPYPYLWLDALTQKVREAGRIVNVSVVVATAVNGDGKREIIGMDVGTSEPHLWARVGLRGHPLQLRQELVDRLAGCKVHRASVV